MKFKDSKYYISEGEWLLFLTFIVTPLYSSRDCYEKN